MTLDEPPHHPPTLRIELDEAYAHPGRPIGALLRVADPDDPGGALNQLPVLDAESEGEDRAHRLWLVRTDEHAGHRQVGRDLGHESLEVGVAQIDFALDGDPGGLDGAGFPVSGLFGHAMGLGEC